MVAYSFKERFIPRIEAGLGIPRPDEFWEKNLPKTQTIRALGKRRHARAGEVLQLYYGMRTRQCRLIGTVKCSQVRPIVIWHNFAIMIGGKIMTASQVNKFAQRDGFDDLEDMRDFWKKEHGDFDKFDGVLIEWEPIR